jgi:predicted lipid-binding transport protein (Tim44 family)
MSTELLIYAIVAAILVFWLRSTLGTRHGEERERPNPLTALKQNQEKPELDGFVFPKPSAPTPSTADDWINLPIRDEAFLGLKLIAASDRNFDAKKFLNGAKDIFPIIVESFAEGDKDSLARFLAPSLYKNFVRAIDDRMARGEVMQTDVHAVREVEIIESNVHDRMAFITVRFFAEETAILKDSSGKILSGHLDKVTDLRDIWVFGRDVKSSDPTWFLFETRDDVPEQVPSQFPHTL